ncbi:MAG: hypothetical protein DYH13_03355 [Alphaproteobacteria bacterium PRO2]|nr:hypothetical protein [Alphaproteobacteria bacterium PRO2]
MFEKFQKHAPAALLLTSLAAPFNAGAEPARCTTSLSVEPSSGNDSNLWSTIKKIRTSAKEQGVEVDVRVYPTSGTPRVYIVNNGTHGEDFSIDDLSVAGDKAIQECKSGAAKTVPVSAPDLSLNR